MQFRVYMDRVNPGQTDESEWRRLAIPANGVTDISASPPEVGLEPAFIHFNSDMTMGCTKAGRQGAVSSPSVDDRHIGAFELSQPNQAAMSGTASVTRATYSASVNICTLTILGSAKLEMQAGSRV